MLEDAIIVQTAASAFNNLALMAPAFLWWAILAMPVFFITFKCAKTIMPCIGWNDKNVFSRTTILTVICAVAWLIMFGGGYYVLRDGASALPGLNAVVLFVGTMFIASHIKSLPAQITPRRRGLLIMCILIAVALTGAPTWWGPILQIGAVMTGALIGRASHTPMRPIAGTLLIILTITTMILMQPEFFRFGKLGELTLAHMISILAVGALSVMTLALNNIPPSSRIHNSAYVKLKWMLRFIVALGIVLMFLTESVPVFLGTLATLFIMFGLSILHADKIPSEMVILSFAMTLGLFGIITTMPVITCTAILLWTTTPHSDFWGNLRKLL